MLGFDILEAVGEVFQVVNMYNKTRFSLREIKWHVDTNRYQQIYLCGCQENPIPSKAGNDLHKTLFYKK